MGKTANWKEPDLFTWLKATIPDLEKAKSRYSRHDCISKSKKMFFELKCRGAHYDTLLIEKKKYDSILNKAIQNDSEAIYVCSTPKGVWSFNLKELSLKWEINHKNPATTSFSNRGRVPKEVSYIPIEQGTQIL